MAVKKAAAPAERVQRESKNKNTGAKANNTIPMEVPKEDVGQRDLKDRKHAIGHGLNEAHAAGVDLKTLKKKGTEASRRGARRAKASRGN